LNYQLNLTALRTQTCLDLPEVRNVSRQILAEFPDRSESSRNRMASKRGFTMSYTGAKMSFEKAKKEAGSDFLHQLAEGLIQLTRELESDIADIKRQLTHIGTRLN
jgi:hypothetical protein